MTPENVEEVVSFVFIVIYCLFIANGIILNAFIAIVNLNCWKRSQSLQTVHIIITCLAMVRIVLLFLYILLIVQSLPGQPVNRMDMYPEYTVTLTLSVEFCSLWWGSVLCVFYCVRITNYNNKIFMRLKMKISKMVPWLLLFSLVSSFLCSLPHGWFVFSIQSFNGTDGRTGGIKVNWFNYFLIYFAGSIIPFIIFCISAGLLILSLLRHTRKMGSRGSGFSDAQRDVHLSVIRNMSSFLFFYVLYFLGSTLIYVSYSYEKKTLGELCAIFFIAFPSLHSISIIVGNKELKNSLLAVIHCSWTIDRSPQST